MSKFEKKCVLLQKTRIIVVNMRKILLLFAFVLANLFTHAQTVIARNPLIIYCETLEKTKVNYVDFSYNIDSDPVCLWVNFSNDDPRRATEHVVSMVESKVLLKGQGLICKYIDKENALHYLIAYSRESKKFWDIDFGNDPTGLIIREVEIDTNNVTKDFFVELDSSEYVSVKRILENAYSSGYFFTN